MWLTNFDASLYVANHLSTSQSNSHIESKPLSVITLGKLKIHVDYLTYKTSLFIIRPMSLLIQIQPPNPERVGDGERNESAGKMAASV